MYCIRGDVVRLTIKEYASSRGVSYEAVRMQLKRYGQQLDGFIERQGRTQYLTDEAVAFLDSKRANSEATANHNSNTTDDTMLKWYQDQIAAKDKQIEELHQLLNQSHQIQGALLAENTKLHALVETSQHEPEDPVQAPEGKEEEVPVNESEVVQATTEPLETPVNEQVRAVPPQAKRSLLEKLRAAFNEFKKD